ncbi:SDR family NAD(P)-dependent oxidoreductase [Kineobactrum salinum]|uniref:SDR family NAD(P)-dependent oxidoreductase n=1 Tax=Kineobactrum salinum TaxID=2708301 RepID=UPI0018D7D258|nr:SDR family NAD(P)-dependent oxidoreductase [Kineobactrum salinum]
MLTSEFEGRVAFITGAGGGMGLQISRQFLAQGGKAVLIDVKQAPPELSEFEDQFHYAQGDLTDENAVQEAMALAASRFGRLDYLVNTAGVLWFDRDKSVVDMDMEVWDQVFNINLKSMAYTIRHAVPLLRASGGAPWCIFRRYSACAEMPARRTPTAHPRRESARCPNPPQSSLPAMASDPT